MSQFIVVTTESGRIEHGYAYGESDLKGIFDEKTLAEAISFIRSAHKKR